MAKEYDCVRKLYYHLVRGGLAQATYVRMMSELLIIPPTAAFPAHIRKRWCSRAQARRVTEAVGKKKKKKNAGKTPTNLHVRALSG